MPLPPLESSAGEANMHMSGAYVPPAGMPKLIQVAVGTKVYRLVDATGHVVGEGDVTEVRLLPHGRVRVTLALEVEGTGIGLQGLNSQGCTYKLS